jgi:hypothetical protein
LLACVAAACWQSLRPLTTTLPVYHYVSTVPTFRVWRRGCPSGYARHMGDALS